MLFHPPKNVEELLYAIPLWSDFGILMHQEIGGFLVLRTKFQRVLAYLGLVDQEKAEWGFEALKPQNHHRGLGVLQRKWIYWRINWIFSKEPECQDSRILQNPEMNSGNSGRKFLAVLESPSHSQVVHLCVKVLVFLLKIPISASLRGNLWANSLWIK